MRIIRSLLIVLLSLMVIVVGVVILAVQTHPSVEVNAAQQVAEADTVHALLEQVESSLRDRHEEHVISISEAQFDSLVGFVRRAKDAFRGEVNVSKDGTRIRLSMALPTPFESYLNVDSLVLPADEFKIEHFTVGNLHLPGAMAVSLVEWAVNRWTQSAIATQAKKQISRVAMTDDTVNVTVRPMDGFLRQLNEVKNGLTVDQDDELRDLTAYYLRYIAWQDLALEETPQPAIDYIRLTFRRAQQKSTPANAVEHNRAALLALAIFLGHHRVANFVGDVQPDADKALKPAKPAMLRGRNDLARHFLISAALKVLSEQGITLAIGEFKELMDRAMGGSGYSFVDLTADMAGVELATVATNPDMAEQVQKVLASLTTEDTIMPPIDGLVEGLSKAEFVERFGEVDSRAYLQEVEKIRARLATIPLYQPRH